MRLQYARLKVDHGWVRSIIFNQRVHQCSSCRQTRQNLNEVENLYFHHYRSRPSPPLPQARGHGRGQSKASHSHQSQSQSQPEQRWAVPSGPSRTANPPSSVQSYPSPPQPDVRSDSPSTQSRPHPPSSPFTFSPPQTHQSRTTAASSAPLSPPLSIGHTPVAFPSTASASNPRAAHSYNPSRASPTATAPATSSSTTTTSATGLNPPLTYDSFWSSLSSPSKLSALSSATAVLASSGSSLRKGSD
ncbi:hypothetical protein BOTBODRAFT_415933 [Botryobasidium botryosum FD-172 SS1]|uniref:Uncharacterized protein n=1 Tax=Botryobasidium botryosum (strain FD-172 SS1) TaxID=930990 RepID=A0A067MKN7_BOTB1|nr:hypothetical protein BOTBODRAFT_415933 [Botryobasidium botryosum FD-172 SS1]